MKQFKAVKSYGKTQVKEKKKVVRISSNQVPKKVKPKNKRK